MQWLIEGLLDYIIKVINNPLPPWQPERCLFTEWDWKCWNTFSADLCPQQSLSIRNLRARGDQLQLTIWQADRMTAFWWPSVVYVQHQTFTWSYVKTNYKYFSLISFESFWKSFMQIKLNRSVDIRPDGFR